MVCLMISVTVSIFLETGSLIAQVNLEVEGNAKISGMDTLNSTSANLVQQTDGTLAIRSFKVGDFAHGGVVFFVDDSGEHGLVCAKEDHSTLLRWFAGTNIRTRAMGDGMFAGEMNTSLIIAGQLSADDGDPYAAYVCSVFQSTEGGVPYGDWYLPSFEELDLMYQLRDIINSTAQANAGNIFLAESYWSSTEDGESPSDLVRRKDFDGGNGASSKNLAYGVRAVRSF
jgi:hypothetical protein